jgi:hypothetical protein
VTATADNNTILAKATPPSTSYGQRTMPSPDPRLVKVIAELGLRYRPHSLAEQEAHAAQIALLTRDLTGSNPEAVARAADTWAKSERWMPKASDLLALMRRTSSGGDREAKLTQHMHNGNAMLAAQGRTDIQWVMRHGELMLESTRY